MAFTPNSFQNTGYLASSQDTHNKENSIAPTPCFPTLPGQSNFSDILSSNRDFSYEMVRSNKQEPSKIGGIVIDAADMLPSRQTEGQSSQGGDYHYQILHSSNPTNFETSLPKETSGFAGREFEYTLERPTEHETKKGLPREHKESSKIGGIVVDPSDMLPSRQTEGQWSQGGDYHYQMLHNVTPNNTEASLSKGTSDKGGFAEREFEYTLERPTEHETKKGPQEQSGFAEREFVYTLERPTEHETKKGPQEQKTPREGKWASRAFSYEYKRQSQDVEHVKPGGIIINPEDALPGQRQNIQEDPHHHFTYELLGQGHHAHGGETYLTSSNPSQDYSSRNTLEKEVGSRMETREPIKTGGILINPEDTLPSRVGELRNVTSHTGGDSYYYAPADVTTSNALKEGQALNLDQALPEKKTKESKPYQFKNDAFLLAKNVVSEDVALVQKKFDKENISYGGYSKGYNTNTTSKYDLTIKEGGYDSIYAKPSDFGTQAQSLNVATRTSLTDLNAPIDDILTRNKGPMSYSSIEGTHSYGYLPEHNDAGFSYNSSKMTSNYTNVHVTSNSTIFEKTSGLYDHSIGGGNIYNF